MRFYIFRQNRLMPNWCIPESLESVISLLFIPYTTRWSGYYVFVHLFVTGKRKRVPFDDLHRITFWVDLCMSVRPSVCPCMFVNKMQVAFIIWLRWNFPNNICLAQGRTLLKLEIIGKNLDIAPIYIFVRFAFYCAPNV